ncbi:DUF3010 family protein [Pontibacterium sp. N1Y112]|uniref:DUF3010 family protein n=1 Tax=Pontibacterium sinense TaxID=2781979 RepID=A0A8J7K4Z4_9GAMM|nr:DUF3010 family protein [Pontibacterium sinense]MBE9396245.1 DUF3010 family protein [Pontibacterium sinense]
MKVCGVELTGSEAIITLLSLSDGLFDIPDCRQRKLTLHNPNNQEEVQHFQFTFRKLMEDYGVECAVIRQRPTTGKFSGSAVGFKLEAAIQLIEGLKVVMTPSSEIKEQLKRNPIMIDFRETGLKKFQEPAFITAYCYLNHMHYNG